MAMFGQNVGSATWINIELATIGNLIINRKLYVTITPNFTPKKMLRFQKGWAVITKPIQPTES